MIFREVKEKEPYVVGTEPVKYVAVVSSEPTMPYRGRVDAGSDASDMIGALQMLDASHIQHDVVADWNLRPDFLRPYQLVVLLNAGCMSETSPSRGHPEIRAPRRIGPGHRRNFAVR